MAKRQLQKKKIKMAMALIGKNNHYHWHNIQHRHFIETAKAVNFSTEKAEIILDEMLRQVEPVIEMMTKQLPHTFPQHISQPIFAGMQSMKQRLQLITF